MTIKLYPHQQKALARLSNGKILCGGTGSGKSLVAVEYYRKVEADADIYVLTTAKKRDSLDWQADFAKIGVGRSLSGTTGGRLVVDSWNNVGRYSDIVGAFFIFDEQRVVGSGEWTKAFLKIAQRNRWILLSATPGDTWLDYIPVFVANGFYPNRSAFKREHVIYAPYAKFPKVDRYVGVGKLVRLRNEILVPMPYLRHTERITQFAEGIEFDQKLMDRVVKERWHVYEERPLKDVAELFSVSRKVANSDLSRIRTIRMLMEEHPKLIVFYNFNYELDLLRTLAENAVSERITSDSSIPLRTTVESFTSAQDPKYPISHMSLRETNGTKQNRDIPELKQKLITDSSNGQRFKSESPIFDPSSCTTQTPVESFLGRQSMENLSTEAGILMTKEFVGISEPIPKPRKSDGFQIAEWNGQKHQEIPKSERWLYLVQYTAGAEGWNCIETDAMVFYSLNYSYKVFEQAYGRIDRLNTPFKKLYYYVFKSGAWIDNAVWKSVKEKRSFNESIYVKGHLGTTRS